MTSSAYWQPFTPTGFREEVGYHTIVAGDGMHVTDTDGHRLLDGTAGLWCVNVGHGRATVADAMAAQAKRLAYYSPFEYRNELAMALADRVAGLTPGNLNHIFFTCSGSESVETAIKVARGYRARRGETGRTKILSRDLGYHGVGLGGTSLSGLTPMRTDFEPLLPHTGRIPHNHCLHCPFGLKRESCDLACANALDYRIQQEGPSSVAAVILEPVIGGGGAVPPPEGYMHAVADICKKHGVQLILDEVITGFGRLGTWFAGHYFGVTPDVMTIAKGLTSAYAPLGGVAVTDEVFDVFVDKEAKPAPEFVHGFTYSGHPVSCAAGMANLDIFEAEDIVGNVKAVTPAFQEAIAALGARDEVTETRGIGFIAAVEYRMDLGPAFARRVTEEAYKRGLIVRPVRNISILSPPLVMTEEQAREIATLLGDAIEAIDA